MLATAIVLWLPGIAGVTGVWPRVAPAPGAFTISGVGVTGDIVGILSLVGLLVAVGWTVTVLAADSLPVRNKCWNKCWEVYDHIWLVSGLVAAVFFIADSQMAQHDADFRETGQDVQRASGYLLKQVEHIFPGVGRTLQTTRHPVDGRCMCIPACSSLRLKTRGCLSNWVPIRRQPYMEMICITPRHREKWTRFASKLRTTIKDFVRWRI